ncbi:MAG: hypothetical protein ACOYLQ_20490 [Hyphomicrobiaceae bacterium]
MSKPYDCSAEVPRKKRGGRMATCAPCAHKRLLKHTRERKRERYATDPEFREREKERKRKQYREKYAVDPEYRERKLERDRKWRREKYAADPEYRERKLERERNRKREKSATDPEFRERENARKSKQKNAERSRVWWIKQELALAKLLAKLDEAMTGPQQDDDRPTDGLGETRA